jgi:hypothetical protein
VVDLVVGSANHKTKHSRRRGQPGIVEDVAGDVIAAAGANWSRSVGGAPPIESGIYGICVSVYSIIDIAMDVAVRNRIIGSHIILDPKN